MASFNKIIIVGYLGRDPESRYTPQGDCVCNFSVATSEKRKDPHSGEQVDHSTWFRVTVWRRQAELAQEYLSKGKLVYVEGRLRQTEYEDRDGNRRQSLEVTASDIQFIAPREASDGGYERPASDASRDRQAKASALGSQAPPQRSAGTSRTRQPTLPGAEGADLQTIDDDDIPF